MEHLGADHNFILADNAPVLKQEVQEYWLIAIC